MSRSTPAVARSRTTLPGASSTVRDLPVPPASAWWRLTVPIGVIAAVAAALVVLVSAGGAQGPATGAATVVPADALAYVHVSIDPGRPAVGQALALASRFPDYPGLRATLESRLAAITGHVGALDYARDLEPWLGRDAAFALLAGSGQTADGLVVLGVRDLRSARAMLARSGARQVGSYHGVGLMAANAVTMVALVRSYLVVGSVAAVHAAIDAARGPRGGAGSLAGNAGYVRAAAGEPADRVLDVYLSADGVERVLMPSRGALGAVGSLLDQPGLTGVTISLSPSADGARVHVHSALDLPAGTPPPASMTPTLARLTPSGSAMMLDVQGLDTDASRLLTAAAAGGVAARIAPLLSRLGAALTSEGVNVRDVLSVFDGETALAIGPVAGGGAPALTLIARVGDETTARTSLASAAAPLSQLFEPSGAGAGQAPLLADQQVGSATVHELELGPGLRLDYTVAGGLAIISTSLAGVTSVLRHARSLADDQAYRATMPSDPRGVTSLVFLDLRQLLSLGEQTGLMRSARYLALRRDLEKVHAVSLESMSGETDSTAELFLQIP